MQRKYKFFGLVVVSLVFASIQVTRSSLQTLAAPMECGDLFFSEYIEGSSYNKAIEIYNGTGASVDLSSYTLELYSNGASSPSQTTTLSGNLADGDVVVLAHSSADAAILTEADILNSSVINFNGDDTLVLRSGGGIVDVIGQVGYRPPSGEWGSGSTSTQNNTIRRQSTIGAGDTNESDVFDPALEWVGYAQDTFDGLGSHTTTGCGGSDTTPPVISATSPTDDAAGVALGSNLVATFNENVQKGTGNITLRLAADDSVVETIDVTSGQVNDSGADVTIDPTSDLVDDTAYYVQFDAGAIEDTSGNDFAGISDATTWNFSTALPRIYDIQGNSATSPMVGSIVTISGIVVGDFQDADELSGFFLQDATGDGEVTTSDGIFIYVPDANLWHGFDVQVGQEIQVTGSVVEDNNFTQIDFVTNITIITAAPNPLSATPVTLPEISNGDLERFEGMLIQISNPMTVAQNYFLGRYGQMTISASGRLYQPTNQFLPGSVEATNLADQNARSILILDDGQDVDGWGDNPNPVPYIGPSPTHSVIRAGDSVSNLIGVLDYGQINSYPPEPVLDYRLHPTEAPIFTAVNTRSASPSSVGGSVTVSSFNVLNYFVTLDDSGNICGPTGGMECRGADSPSEFTRQRDKIIAALCSIDADVFGLMELENTNPSNDPNPGDGISNYVLLDLVNGLNDCWICLPR